MGQSDNYITLADDRRIPLTRLPDLVPSSCFMGAPHVTACERLAREHPMPAELYPVYVNLLVQHSHKARQLTALSALVSKKVLDVREVSTDFFPQDVDELLGEGIRVHRETPRHVRPMIDWRRAVRFSLKSLAHICFRVLRRRRIETRELARAWVDTTSTAFPSELGSATLLIYPFGRSFIRQVRFMLRCRKRGLSSSLMGIPYSLRDIARLLLHPSKRDLSLTLAEFRGFVAHAKELSATGARTVYTTDEFDPGGTVFHSELMTLGVTCINRAHGVGVYGPYVNYTRFDVFSARQRAYYERRGNVLQYRHIHLAGSPGPLPAVPERDSYRPAVVLMLGNWVQAGKRYEAGFEDAMIPVIREACAKSGMPFFIKAHPNCSSLDLWRLRRRAGVQVTRELDNLATMHLVFINTASSAYYRFLYRGPTVFLRERYEQARALFGESIYSVRPEELEPELKRFTAPAYWAERLRHQVEIENAPLDGVDGDPGYATTTSHRSGASGA